MNAQWPIGWESPWAQCCALLMLFFTVLDSFLSKRYAAGDGTRDAGTASLLIASLGLNTAVLLLTPLVTDFGLWPASYARFAPWGLAVSVLGMAVRYAAIFTLRDRFTWRVTILAGHEIIDRGVYRLVRHPSYSGGMLAMLGAYVAFGHMLGLVLFCLTHVPAVIWRIRCEERVLRSHFGERYRRYEERTARLVPLLY